MGPPNMSAGVPLDYSAIWCLQPGQLRGNYALALSSLTFLQREPSTKGLGGDQTALRSDNIHGSGYPLQHPTLSCCNRESDFSQSSPQGICIYRLPAGPGA